MFGAKGTKLTAFLPFPSVAESNEAEIDFQTASIVLRFIENGTIPPRAWSRLGAHLDEIKRIAGDSEYDI